MGLYTEIYVNVNLVEPLPQSVMDTLNAMCLHNIHMLRQLGKPDRWSMLFSNGSYYHPSTEVAKFTWDEIGKCYSILGKGDIKNYENEIEQFFEWLMPYIDAPEGMFIGYQRYEEDLTPTLYFKTK